MGNVLAMDIRVQKRGLARVQQALSSSLGVNKSDPIMRKAFEEWGAEYNKFIKARFARNSEGGGSWAPLKAKTIQRKKRIGSPTPSKILREFSHLYDAIPTTFTSTRGWRSYHTRAGISCGYSSRNKHPGSKLSYAKLVRVHGVGAGVVPKRQIIVKPDMAFKRKIARILSGAIENVARNSGS